ncbi:DUF222 domain-containing protein [Fodinicola feengrottensis]|uniref:DUF222 domain-containing protein n=1 Tax=Fodinicola feengrottensis TaxID=435914 RepID=UPI002442B21D|nr:DUF222 domain-containing protein [Fodinicola feengrottensis]
MLEELDRYGRADADTALAAIETLDKVISYAQAMQMRFMDRFTNARPAVGAPFSKYAAGEIAAMLTWSVSAAQKRLNLAYQLVHELPGTMAGMSHGALDLRKAFTFADQVGHLSPEDARRVEEKVLPGADSKTPRSIRDRARREVIKIDPAAAEARRKKLVSERRVEKQPCEDGMALLGALLPAESAEAIYRRIDAIARSLKAKDESRTMDALRADALTDLCLGVPSNVRTKIELRVDATTLMGLDDNPAILSGYGPMTAQRARELAGDENSEWYRILTDPVSGVVIDHGRTRYRPTRALRDLVNARDQRCCGPACNRPAATCEFDHTIPFRDPEGKTAYDSAGSACKFHNDIKEHGWTRHPTDAGPIPVDQPHRSYVRRHPQRRIPTTTVLAVGRAPVIPGSPRPARVAGSSTSTTKTGMS